MPERPNVLVLRRRYLSEIVLLGPLLRNLRLHWPEAHLTVAVESRFADVPPLNPDVSATVGLPTRLREWPRFLRAVRWASFSHVIDLDNTKQSASIARLSGAPIRIALSGGSKQPTLRAAYTHHLAATTTRGAKTHVSASYFRALEPLGVAVKTREFRLEPRDADVTKLRRFVGASERVLLVHPGTRGGTASWPADRFAQVIDFAQDELGAQVILLGGVNDAGVLATIHSNVRTHLLNLPLDQSVPHFAALARISDAVLCHDSGFMHVAAGVGTPVVALFGEPAPEHEPLGSGHQILRASVPPLGEGEAAPTRIPADDVIAAIRAVFAAQPPKSSKPRSA